MELKNWYTIFEKSFLSCTSAPNILRYAKHRASEFLNLSSLFIGSIPMDPSPTNRDFQTAIGVGRKSGEEICLSIVGNLKGSNFDHSVHIEHRIKDDLLYTEYEIEIKD